MHNTGVVLACEYVTSATYICCQLVNFIKASINGLMAEVRITQVANHEIIGYSLREFIELKINASDPEVFILQTAHQVTAYKAPSSKYKSRSQFDFPRFITIMRSQIPMSIVMERSRICSESESVGCVEHFSPSIFDMVSILPADVASEAEPKIRDGILDSGGALA